MCRCNTVNKDIKANNYQVHKKKIYHGTPENALHWYIKTQEVIQQKPCENSQAKLTMMYYH